MSYNYAAIGAPQLVSLAYGHVNFNHQPTNSGLFGLQIHQSIIPNVQ